MRQSTKMGAIALLTILLTIPAAGCGAFRTPRGPNLPAEQNFILDIQDALKTTQDLRVGVLRVVKAARDEGKIGSIAVEKFRVAGKICEEAQLTLVDALEEYERVYYSGADTGSAEKEALLAEAALRSALGRLLELQKAEGLN